MEVRTEFPHPDLEWEATAEFWSGAARSELRVPRCDRCARLHWYPTERCRHCKGEVFTWETMSGRGKLFSWVVVTHPFLPQFADLVPFVPALVALEEDPSVRIPTRMVDCDPTDLTFEMPVAVAFRSLEFTGVEGATLAPCFVPA